MTDLINRLSKFFISRGNVLGQTTIDNSSQVEGQKVKASVITKTEAVTSLNWEEHLSGKTGIGLSPILQNNKCKWAALDIDTYNIDIGSLSKKFSNLPVFFCRTKSGGLHIYFFFKRETKAKEVRFYLEEFASLLQFNKIEIFPKQETLKEEDSANWINIPYFNGDKTNRYCIYNGIQLTLEQFISTAHSNLIENFDQDVLSHFQLSGAPPCLLKMYSEGIVKGYRDIFLFNLAIFFKQKYRNDWEDRLRTFNEENVNPPLGEKELENTIIKQVKKKDIFYQCKGDLQVYCNKKVCKLKKYGIITKNSPDILIGKLIKINTIPPVWKIEVEEKEIEVTTDELMNQNDFRKKCIEVLNKIPPKVKQNDWDEIIQDRLDTMEIIEAPEDASADADLIDYIIQFCCNRSNSRQLSDVRAGKVFIQDGMNIFQSLSLFNYLRVQKKYTKCANPQQLWIKLRNIGASAQKIGRLNVWSLPLFEEQKVVKEERKDINWSDYDTKEEF